MKSPNTIPHPTSSGLNLSKPFVDSIPNGLIVTDPDLTILHVNRWITKNINIGLEDLVGKSIGNAFPELTKRNLMEAYRLVIQTGMPITLANRIHGYFIKCPPSSSFSNIFSEMPQSAIISPLFENDVMIGTLTTVIDVTERVLTEQALQNEVHKLNALNSVARALSTLDIDKCLQTIVKNSQELFEAEVAGLFLFNKGELEISCQYPEGQGFPQNLTLFKSVTENLKSESISGGFPVQNGKVQSIPAPSEMAAPLIVENQCIGVLNVRSLNQKEYTQDDLHLLDVLAAHSSIAIHNANLHRKEKAQRQLLESLKDTSITMTSNLDSDYVLDSLLLSIEHVLPYDTARVMLVDGDLLTVIRQRGYDEYGVQEFWEGREFSFKEFPYLLQTKKTHSPLIITDTQQEPNWLPLDGLRHVRSCGTAPIFIRGTLTGFFMVEKTEAGFYDEDFANILASFSVTTGIALDNARLFEQQKRLAVIDGLTGVANRRAFDEILIRELERSKRLNHNTSLIMIDIDHFKRYNDTYGHLVGDTVLKNLAALLQQSLRLIDTVARFGGEEFVIILPETGVDHAVIVGERLREKIEQMHLNNPLPDLALPDEQVTASIGISTSPQIASTPDDLIRTADQALYHSKNTGRNRVSIFGNMS